MCIELKKAIIEWFIDHKDLFSRTNNCVDTFKAYIYDSNGMYLIGGERVIKFIRAAETILFSDEEDYDVIKNF